MAGEDPEITLQSSQPTKGASNGGPVAAGQVGTAAAALEQGVTGENRGFAQQADAAGGMAGSMQDRNFQACQLQLGAVIDYFIAIAQVAHKPALIQDTGSTGTYLYTGAGLPLMLTSIAFLLYRYKKRRKDVH